MGLRRECGAPKPPSIMVTSRGSSYCSILAALPFVASGRDEGAAEIEVKVLRIGR